MPHPSYFEIGKPCSPSSSIGTSATVLFRFTRLLSQKTATGPVVRSGGSAKHQRACLRASGIGFSRRRLCRIAQEATGDFVGHSFYASAWLEESTAKGWLGCPRIACLEPIAENAKSHSRRRSDAGAAQGPCNHSSHCGPRVTMHRSRRSGEFRLADITAARPQHDFQLPFVDASEVMRAWARWSAFACYECAGSGH